MKGFINLSDLNFLANSEIICLVETHLISDVLLSQFDDYTLINVCAVKEKRFGRASGGLMLLVTRNMKVSILDKCKHWIFVNISSGRFSFILGIVYFRPSLDINVALDLLELTINNIRFNYASLPVFIAGDFNSRVADLNQGDENVFHGTSLSHIRRNKDGIGNIRGETRN